MADEFKNKQAPEFNAQVENKFAKENFTALENKAAVEMVPVDENKDTTNEEKLPKKAVEKKKQRLGVLSAGLVGTVALVLATVTDLVNVKMRAKFDDEEKPEYLDGKIAYKINIENMTEKESLLLKVKRGNVLINTYTFEDKDGTGFIKDGYLKGFAEIDKEYLDEILAKDENLTVKYYVELKGIVGLDIERLFDRWAIQIEKRTSRFNGVEGHCNCGVDGYYYFTMDFDDASGYYSDFEAWIEDTFYLEGIEDSHIARWEQTGDLHEEQRIFVDNLEGSKGTLFIKFKLNGEDVYATADGLSTEKVGIPINM